MTFRIELSQIGHGDDCDYGAHPWYRPYWWFGKVDPNDVWVDIGDLNGRPDWCFSAGVCGLGVIFVWRYPR